MNQVAEHQVPATDTMTKVQPFVPLWGLAVAGAVIIALILTIASNSVFGLDSSMFSPAPFGSVPISSWVLLSDHHEPSGHTARMVFAKKL